MVLPPQGDGLGGGKVFKSVDELIHEGNATEQSTTNDILTTPIVLAKWELSGFKAATAGNKRGVKIDYFLSVEGRISNAAGAARLALERSDNDSTWNEINNVTTNSTTDDGVVTQGFELAFFNTPVGTTTHYLRLVYGRFGGTSETATIKNEEVSMHITKPASVSIVKTIG